MHTFILRLEIGNDKKCYGALLNWKVISIFPVCIIVGWIIWSTWATTKAHIISMPCTKKKPTKLNGTFEQLRAKVQS